MTLGVLPAFRGRGIGSLLLDAVVERLSAANKNKESRVGSGGKRRRREGGGMTAGQESGGGRQSTAESESQQQDGGGNAEDDDDGGDEEEEAAAAAAEREEETTTKGKGCEEKSGRGVVAENCTTATAGTLDDSYLRESSDYAMCRDISLHVHAGNVDATRFYTRPKTGFSIASVKKGYYKRLEPPDALILKKVL